MCINLYFISKDALIANALLCSQSFPIRSKFHWTVGPVNLKVLPVRKKFHQTVGVQWPILTLLDQKTTTK